VQIEISFSSKHYTQNILNDADTVSLPAKLLIFSHWTRVFIVEQCSNHKIYEWMFIFKINAFENI